MTQSPNETNSTASSRSVQVLILGGGPGGYSCALRAAKLGLDVLMVESHRAGGTCLHAGCIPSKALIQAASGIHAARESCVGQGPLAEMGIVGDGVRLDFSTTQQWKQDIVERLASGVEGLLAKASVRTLHGTGEMLDGRRCRVTLADDPKQTLEIVAEHVVLALGATEVELAALPASEDVLYSEAALSLTEIPDRLAVVGGGYIGLELGQAFAKLGSTVTVVEAASQLLPAYPAPLVAPVRKALDRLGVSVHTGARAEGFHAGKLSVAIDTPESAALEIEADKVLVAVGRKANLSGWGREQLALDLADGFVAIDRRCETSMSGVFAVGDVTGEPMLAHRAIAQGQVVAECLAGRRRQFAPIAVPAVCFTSPEIVSVGDTAASARASGMTVEVARFPLAANGRAVTLGDAAGFVEVVAEADSHALVGVQAVGEHVAELVHAFTLALEMGARLEDIVDTIHAHPTVGESFAEASMAALGLGAH